MFWRTVSCSAGISGRRLVGMVESASIDRTGLICHGEGMIARRLLVLLAAVSLFLTNSAGCFGAGVSAAQAHACCRMGHCAPQKSGPCSQVSPRTTPKAVHDRETATFERPTVAASAVAVSAEDGVGSFDTAGVWLVERDALNGQPPGAGEAPRPLRV